METPRCLRGVSVFQNFLSGWSKSMFDLSSHYFLAGLVPFVFPAFSAMPGIALKWAIDAR